MSSLRKRARSFCFTHNNYGEDDLASLQALTFVKYGCVGKEIGESGTPHLQGYLLVKNPKELSAMIKALKNALGTAPHVEICKGSPQSNIEYCSKGGDVTEWGTKPKMGRRMDLEHAAEMVREGKRMIEIADEHPGTFIRYHKGIRAYKELHDAEKAAGWRDVKCYLLTGPTGCGKTRHAMASADRVYKIQGSDLQWWDGYEGEETILIDEYANDMKITKLLALLDGYKLRLPVKGGFTYAAWKEVWITTNLMTLHDQAAEEHRRALARRITKTVSYWEASQVSAMAATSSAD